MPSIHASLMRHGTELYLAVQGEKGTVQYAPPKRPPFDWPNCIVGGERGGIDENNSGDLVKVVRRTVTGPVGPLAAKSIKGLNRDDDVIVAGTHYSIDLTLSHWGPELVRLELVKRTIARHQDMEDRTR